MLRSNVWALLLVLGAWSLGAYGVRRSGAEGGASKAAVPTLTDEDCRCPGTLLSTERLAPEVRENDGLLRLRKAAQRICDGLVGTGSLGGAAHATAFFSACKKDGEEPGYCCKGSDSEELAEKKKQAPEAIGQKNAKLYTEVNSGYRNLQRALEDANIDGSAPDSLGQAAVLFAEQRQAVEQREARCRADMDNLKECGDPTVFLLDLRHLYTDLARGLTNLSDAAAACTSPRKKVLGAVARGGRMVTQKSTSFVARAAHYGRRVIAFTWRNRVRLMASVVIAKGAGPFIHELVDSGMDKALAAPLGEAFANVVVAMKSISCQVVQEPLLMAALMSLSARFLGNVMVAATPAKKEGVTLEGFKEAEDVGLLADIGRVPKAFVNQVRDFGEVLASSTAVPVVSELLVVFASDFFEELAGAICEALGESGGPAVAVPAVKSGKVSKAKQPAPKPASFSSKTLKEPRKALPRQSRPVQKPKKVTRPKTTGVAASAVPKGGANTLAAGALSGFFTGTNFVSVGRDGAKEVAGWASHFGSEGEPKPRRGKRDRDFRKGRSLMELGSDGSVLLESKEGGVVDSLGNLAGWFLNFAGSKPLPAELQELQKVLKNTKNSMPMLTLLAYSAEHVLALMSGSDSDFEFMACTADAADCEVPSLPELKDKSKDMLTKIAKLCKETISQCSSTGKSAKEKED